ncbi:hypothetical protein ABZ079_07175 [Streptomyces sp. NPDC006314]|uniref:hypothetical protein n=1 Tax=Streptomyces sp. NPDC006314 TaxID=3154475 RepID=UPI0033ADE56F
MSSWLRLSHHCVRLLLVLTAALPVYGAVTAYGTVLAYAVEPDASHAAGGRPALPAHPAPPVPLAPPDSERPDHLGHEQADRPGPGRSHQAAAGAWAVPTPSDSASASVRPSHPATEPSRAGSRAGEGRMRPGRPDGPAAEVEGDDDTLPIRASDTAGQPEEPETADVPGGTQGASQPPEEAGLEPTRTPRPPAAQQPVQQGEARTEPVLQILPLGSGLVLIGLGLGLALLGLRLRKS